MISLLRTKNQENLRLAKFISKTLSADDKLKLASWFGSQVHIRHKNEYVMGILLEEKDEILRKDLTKIEKWIKN